MSKNETIYTFKKCFVILLKLAEEEKKEVSNYLLCIADGLKKGLC
jgi:hypothetical protein